MDAKIKSIEEKLLATEMMLHKTEDWWADMMQKKLVELENLKKKMNKVFTSDEEDDFEIKMERINEEIRHLILKREWEKRQIKQWEKDSEKFQKAKEQAMMSELSKKIQKPNENKGK